MVVAVGEPLAAAQPSRAAGVAGAPARLIVDERVAAFPERHREQLAARHERERVARGWRRNDSR